MKRTITLLAVLLLLLRPVCDALAAGQVHAAGALAVHVAASHGSDGADRHGELSCCSDVGDGALVKPGDPVVRNPGADGKFEPYFVQIRAAAASRGEPLPDPRQPPGAFFTTLSYYARSARILR